MHGEALPRKYWEGPSGTVNMALSGLMARLNCREYKNWMKAGHCLMMLQRRLQAYIDREMMAFHRLLTAQIRGPPPRRRCQCRAKGKEFQPGCPVCAQWKELILAHHNHRDGEIHWGNSEPSLWPTHYWEVAKVYMPRGQAQKNGPDECDAAALLNLINTCDYFRIRNLSRVREILLSDWNIEYKLQGKFQTDGLPQAQSLSKKTDLYEVEIRLIEQLFQELYLDIEEHGSLTEENETKVSKMRKFLSQNEDLKIVFQEDLEWHESLWRNPVPLHGEGWTPNQRSAAVFVAISLAFLTAIFLHFK